MKNIVSITEFMMKWCNCFYEALYNDNVLAYNVHDGKEGISDLLII